MVSDFDMRPPAAVRNLAGDLVEIAIEVREGVTQKVILSRAEAVFLEGVLRGARHERENQSGGA